MAPRVQVRLDGDASGLIAASAQGGKAIDQVAGSATRAGVAAARNMTPAVNAARGAMASLATQALGVPGPLGVVIAQFGSLGAGSAVMAAALGGLALLAIAWKEITKESRLAAEGQQKAIDAMIEGNRVGRLGPAGELPGQIAQGRAALIPLRAREESITRLQGLGLAGTRAPEQLAAVRKEIADLLEVIRRAKERADKAYADAAADTAKPATAAAEKAAAEALAEAEKRAAKRAAELEAAFLLAGKRAVEFAQSLNQVIYGIQSHARTGAPGGMAGEVLRQQTETGLAGIKIPTTLTPHTAAPNLTALAAGDQPMGMLGKAASMAGNALQSFGPAALAVAALFEVLRGVMEPLQPILDVVSGLLQSIGNVIGVFLAPVLKVVAKVFSYVVQAVGVFVEALGKFVDKIVPDWISKVGKGLAKAGQQMQDDAKAGRKAMDQEAVYDNLADAATGAAAALGSVATGLPSWFKLDAYRFRAAAPGATSGSGGGAATTSTTIGTVHVTLAPPAGADGPTMLRILTAEVKKVRGAGGIVELDLVPV